jgi:hypothetical protein
MATRIELERSGHACSASAYDYCVERMLLHRLPFKTNESPPRFVI